MNLKFQFISKYFSNIVLILTMLVLIGNFQIVSSDQTNASLTCAYVKKQTSGVFKENWTEKQSKEPLSEFSRRISRAYKMIFTNQGCFKKSEIAEMKKAISDMKLQCTEAKKDAFTWAYLKDICGAFSGIYKYAKH